MSRFRKHIKSILETVLRYRSATVLSLVVLIALLLAAFHWLQVHSEPNYVVLFGDRRFTVGEVANIDTVLTSAELTEHKVDNGKIAVPESDRAKYLSVINQANILTLDLENAKSKALEQGTIFESSAQQKRRLQHVLEQEIARTVRHFDGIDEATVRLEELIEHGLKRKRIQSGIVRVICSSDRHLDEILVEKIRQTVAAHRLGLSPEQITVIDLSSGDLFPAGVSTSKGLVMEELLEEKATLEQHWNQKIKAAIDFVPGANVAVNCNLSFDAKDDSGDSKEPKKAEKTSKLAVLVRVPNSYYVNLWHAKRHAAKATTGMPATAEEIQSLRQQTQRKIESAVQVLCSTEPWVTKVCVTPFDDLVNNPQRASQAGANWPYGLIVLLGFIAILLLYSRPIGKLMKKSLPSGLQADLKIVEERMETQISTSKPPSELSDEQLRNQLSEVVRKNPESAAKVLQSWMRKAS